MVLSLLPEANVFPSELNTTDLTAKLCPLSSFIRSPLSKFQIFIVRSLLPDAKVLPSGLNATEFTQPLC